MKISCAKSRHRMPRLWSSSPATAFFCELDPNCKRARRRHYEMWELPTHFPPFVRTLHICESQAGRGHPIKGLLSGERGENYRPFSILSLSLLRRICLLLLCVRRGWWWKKAAAAKKNPPLSTILGIYTSFLLLPLQVHTWVYYRANLSPVTPLLCT